MCNCYPGNVKTYDKDIPTVDQILEFRQLDIDKQDDWRVIEFVWTRLMPAAFGKSIWNKENCTKTLVSQLFAAKKDGKRMKQFNISLALEAFMVVVYENNYEKWNQMIDDMKTPPAEARGMDNSQTLKPILSV